jgi:hypothetical protein
MMLIESGSLAAPPANARHDLAPAKRGFGAEYRPYRGNEYLGPEYATASSSPKALP